MRLAVLGLVLGAEVTAAALVAVEGVAAHQLGQLEEVVDPTGLLEALVDAVAVAGHPQVLLELLVAARGSPTAPSQALRACAPCRSSPT